jgi:hypothetical protein
MGATPKESSGTKMSSTAALGLKHSATLFSRLLSAIDRILMKNAEIAHRNGDLPYFGL